MVNGKQGNHFKIKRGLNQGCSLSPLLFILVADAFDAFIKCASKSCYISGLGSSSQGWSISNFHFTYDILLFCKCLRFQVICLKILLYNFVLASCLKINCTKSSIILLGEDRGRSEIISNLLNCRTDFLPIKYLGLPLYDCKIFKEECNKLIDRIDKRLSGWK